MKLTSKGLIVFLLFMTPLLGVCQTAEEDFSNQTTAGDGIGNPDCDPLDPKCPIDGGLAALLAVGVGYGVKKVRDARKESQNSQ